MFVTLPPRLLAASAFGQPPSPSQLKEPKAGVIPPWRPRALAGEGGSCGPHLCTRCQATPTSSILCGMQQFCSEGRLYTKFLPRRPAHVNMTQFAWVGRVLPVLGVRVSSRCTCYVSNAMRCIGTIVYP